MALREEVCDLCHGQRFIIDEDKMMMMMAAGLNPSTDGQPKVNCPRCDGVGVIMRWVSLA